MIFLKRAFYSLYKLYLAALFIVLIIPFYPFFWILIRQKKFESALALEKIFSYIALPMAGIFVVVKRPKNIPQQPFIICPNHSSYFDIFACIRAMPGYFVFLGKAELKHWPVFNIFFNSGMNILVNRDNKIGSAQAFKKSIIALQKNQNLIIFPEATIPKKVPQLKSFKDGAFALAIKMQVPILPVTFLDNYKILQTGGFFKSKAMPGRCRVIIHEPINTIGLTQNDLVSLRQQTFEIIQKPFLQHEH